MAGYANGYTTTLTAGITSGATTCIVASTTGIPPLPFTAVIAAEGVNTDEIVQVTNNASGTFTITRAYELTGGNGASAHGSGATLAHVITVGSFVPIQADTQVIASAGTAQTLDPTQGSVFDITLNNASPCVFTFSPSNTISGRCYSMTLILRQDSNGSRTVTWPGSVTWSGATPVLATAGNAINFYTLFTVNAGTTWYGFAATTNMSNPMITQGDVIIGGVSGAPARLAAGAAGTVLRSAGTGASETFAYPPAYEFDYVQKTSNTTISASSEGTANTIVTGASVIYDGATTVMVKFFTPQIQLPSTTGATLLIGIWDNGTVLGYLTAPTAINASNDVYGGFEGEARFTPTNAAHQYSIRAYITAGASGLISGGAGGAGTFFPCFMRVVKV